MQDPRGLEERVEVFLEQFEKDLQKMSDEDFKVLGASSSYTFP
jgi:insulysin